MQIKKFVAALMTAGVCSSLFASPILWVGDGGGKLGTVDVASGTTTIVGNMGHVMTDIAFDVSGNLWGTDGSTLYRINSSTAAATSVGAMGAGYVNSLVFGADGTLYGANNGLYTINTTTGAASLIGTGGYSSSGDLAFVGGVLYLSSTIPTSDTLWKVNTTTGAGTSVGALGASGFYGLATDNNVDLYGLAGNSVYDIDTATGASTLLVSYAGGLGTVYGTAFRTEAGAPIPEPGALSLVLGALIGLGLTRRRRG